MFLFFVAMGMMLSATVAQVSVWDGTHTAWTNGAGTQSNPYLIETAQHLAYLAVYVNNGTEEVHFKIVGKDKYWKLTTDIDLNSMQWDPIGFYNGTFDQYFFGGHFDGGGHTIANLVTSGKQRAGLFGQMDGGSVKNVGIIGNTSISAEVEMNSYYDAVSYAGGIVGYVSGSSSIENCNNTGNVSAVSSNSTYASYSYSGGIVGYSNGNIENCYNSGNISASSAPSVSYSCAGGITGRSNGSIVRANASKKVSLCKIFRRRR